jgi:LysR family transcriptional regulator, nitrogen assimilation regulatory protein
MELLELRYFVTVADAGSFSRASVKLGMTQPALSRQIQKLEEELRTNLFYRHGRGVTLTDAGRKLSDVVRPVMQQLADIKEEILEEGDRPAGMVAFGVPPSIGNTLAAPLAQRFRAACPSATLRIHEAFSSTLVEWIESGRLDFAVLYDAGRNRNLVASPLLLEDFFLIRQAGQSPTSSPVTMSDLADLTFVLPGPENGFRRVIDAAVRRAKVDLTVAMELDSVSALKQLVEAGVGFTVLPFGAVHREVREGRLIAQPIKSEGIRGMLVTATPLHRPVSKATRVLMRLVHAEIRRCIAAEVLKGELRLPSRDYANTNEPSHARDGSIVLSDLRDKHLTIV